MTARLFVTLALVLGTVALGDLAGDQGRLYADVCQFVVGAFSAWPCLVQARGRTRAQRRWRLIAAAGLAAWALARLVSVVRDLATPGAPAGALAGLSLVLPACVLLGLLTSIESRPRQVPTSIRRDQLALLIDGSLIAGSLLAISWSLLPGDLLHRADHGVLAAYPVADLALLTMVVLLLATRPASSAQRRPLLFVGAALIAFGVSDTTHLYAPTGPLIAGGQLLGAALIGLAAFSPRGGPLQGPVAAERDWVHLLLPYVPVIATGVVIAVSTGGDRRLTPFEAYLGWLALGLVVARQMFTIVDNTVLLDRVSEGQRRLQHQAYHDPLTGLPNRALFHERLVRALDAHRATGRPVAVLFADLDDFKLINDSFGHATGDRVLHAIGERLLACVGPQDLVARLGGDEFAAVLDHTPADAEPTGDRILAALREPFLIDGRTVGVGASIGLVVPGPGEPLTADALLRRADAAMYASKRRGKGAMFRYAGGPDGGPNADLPHQLAEALAGGHPAAAGFDVHYQPIVRLTDGVTVAVEALARWTDPVAGPVHPDVFVTVAERTGLVAAIDDFVLDQACADAADLATLHGNPVEIHVNVSAARLGPGLEDGIHAALARHNVHPSRLVVEITETRRIPDLPDAAGVASRLRAHGIKIALDDFGSGFNALAQLHALPVDIVKLDSTLTDVDVTPDLAGALCSSILTICAAMNIAVIAEGIETTTRATALQEIGCPYGQGYLYGQPAPLQHSGPAASSAAVGSPRPANSLPAGLPQASASPNTLPAGPAQAPGPANALPVVPQQTPRPAGIPSHREA